MVAPVDSLYFRCNLSSIVDAHEKALALLRQTEGELRVLVGAAAERGDYEGIATITALAKAVRDLANGRAKPAERSTTAGLSRTGRGRGTASPKAKRKARKKDYPRFRIEDDHLIKVAWSKSQGGEYEHRAPLSVLTQLVDTLLSGTGELFTMDAVLPLSDDGGSEIPSYQAYLCLAWLKMEGLVFQEGRKGYSLSTSNLKNDVRHRLKEQAT